MCNRQESGQSTALGLAKQAFPRYTNQQEWLRILHCSHLPQPSPKIVTQRKASPCTLCVSVKFQKQSQAVRLPNQAGFWCERRNLRATLPAKCWRKPKLSNKPQVRESELSTKGEIVITRQCSSGSPGKEVTSLGLWIQWTFYTHGEEEVLL